MLGRRFVIVVVVLMGLTVVAASLAPRQPVPRDQRAAQPTPTPAPAVEGEDTSPAEEAISVGGAPDRVVLDQGQLLELTVEGTGELDSVSLRDEVEPITPEAPAIFNVYGDVPGEYAIVLEGEQRPIGTLIIRRGT